MNIFSKNKVLKSILSVLVVFSVLFSNIPVLSIPAKAVDSAEETTLNNTKINTASENSAASTKSDDEVESGNSQKSSSETDEMDEADIAKQAKYYNLTIEQFKKAAELHGSMDELQNQLFSYEISKNNLILSEENQKNIVALIAGGYTTSQAFAANVSSKVLHTSIDTLIRYKKDELETRKAEEKALLTLDLEEQINASYSKDENYLKLSKQMGVPYLLIDDYFKKNNNDSSKILNDFKAVQAKEYLQKAETKSKTNSKVPSASKGLTASNSTGGEFTPQKILGKPFSYDKIVDSSVNLNTGAFTYEENDLSIPGVNGLDLNIVRQYNSEDAALKKQFARFEYSDNPAFSVGFRPYLWRNNKEDAAVTFLEDYTTSDGKSFDNYFLNDDYYREYGCAFVRQDNIYPVFATKFKSEEYLEAAALYKKLSGEWVSAKTNKGSAKIYFKPFIESISPNFKNSCLNDAVNYDTFNKKEYGMGGGWRLGFSAVETYYAYDNYITYTEHKRLITSTGAKYNIAETADQSDSNLEGYKLNDLRFESNGNGYPGASYTLFHADGKKEYFDSNGRNIAIVDKYGNKITLSYTIVSGKVTKIEIIDTLGHAVVYQNNNIDPNVTLKENKETYNEKWTLSVDGEVIKTYYIYNYTSSITDTRINDFKLIKNENNEYINLGYGTFDGKFNSFLSSVNNDDAKNVYLILNSVIYPNKKKLFVTYQQGKRGLGYSGCEEYPQIATYEQIYDRSDRDITKEYKKYSFGEYSNMYGTKNYQYETGVVNERFKDSNGHLIFWGEQEKLYSFNEDHLKISETEKYKESKQDELVQSVDDTDGVLGLSNKTEYKYNSTDLPTSVTTTKYTNPSTVGMTVNQSYTYDSKGNVLTQTLPNNNGGTYTITNTYDSAYNMPLTTEYNQDAGKIIKLENILTSDKKGIQTSLTRENGVQKARTDYAYSGNGQVLSVKAYTDDANFTEEQFEYGTDSKREAQVTADKTIGVRDANGTLADGSNGYSAGTIVTKTQYDKFGRPVKKTDPNGNETGITYDPIGRVTAVTNPDGSSNTYAYAYDVLNDIVTHTDERGAQIRHLYDKFGNEVSALDMKTNQTLYSKRYDSFNRLIEETVYSSNGQSKKTYYYYDVYNRIIEKGTKNSAGALTSKETYEYTFENGLEKITKTVAGDSNAPSIVTVTYQNSMGNIVSADRGTIKNCVKYLYDYIGNKLKESTLTDNNQYSDTSWEYNYAGKPVKTINACGDFATSEYNGLGQLVRSTDFASNSQGAPYSTTYEYDSMGRLLKETTPFERVGAAVCNAVKTYGYDRNGNAVNKTVLTNKPGEGAQTSTVTYQYDNRNMLVRTETDGNYTTYTYDKAGNQLTVVTGNGTAKTEYSYDHRNRPLTVTDPLGLQETYAYDQNGNMLSKTDKNGNITSFEYDDLGRNTAVRVKSADGKLLNSKILSYTLPGQIFSEQNENIGITRKYDEFGRLASETESNGTVKSYSYNNADMRTGYVLSRNGSQQINTAYGYDSLNRLSTVLENGAPAASYTYDKNGNRASVTNGNGTSTIYSYNAANLVTSLQNKKGGETISAYNYTYYLDGNQAGKADHTGKVTNYTYDESRRLTQEAESGVSDAVTKNYTFDASSNRKAMSVTGAKSYTVGYKYDLDNRLLTEVKNEGSTTETTDYFYDNNGNTISKNTSTMGNSSAAEKVGLSLGHTDGTEFYVYDGLNQLVKAENAKGTSTYAYRPDGLRLSKTVNGVTTTHVWNGQDISLDLDGSGNLIDRYIRGNGLIRSDKNGWYLYNAHGDVVQLSNNSGDVTKTYDYDAFGNENNTDENDTNPYRYCGEYFDKETGTVYLRARYYDPTIGRFQSEDTHWNTRNSIYGDDPLMLNQYTAAPDIAAIMQSSNLYVYTMNNPIRWIDLSGKAVTDWDRSVLPEEFVKCLEHYTKNWSRQSSEMQKRWHNDAERMRSMWRNRDGSEYTDARGITRSTETHGEIKFYYDNNVLGARTGSPLTFKIGYSINNKNEVVLDPGRQMARFADLSMGTVWRVTTQNFTTDGTNVYYTLEFKAITTYTVPIFGGQWGYDSDGGKISRGTIRRINFK